MYAKEKAVQLLKSKLFQNIDQNRFSTYFPPTFEFGTFKFKDFD